VASIDTVRERLALQRYLDSLEKADEEPQTNIDQSAVQAALEKLKQNPEPEAGFMQTAVDTEHTLIVAHAVVLDASDIRSWCNQTDGNSAPRVIERSNSMHNPNS
jgi:hypothetical protein